MNSDILFEFFLRVSTGIPSGVPPGTKLHERHILVLSPEIPPRAAFWNNQDVSSEIPSRNYSEISTGMLKRLFSEISLETFSDVQLGVSSGVPSVNLLGFSQEFLRALFQKNFLESNFDLEFF